jgi:hypothetical protein
MNLAMVPTAQWHGELIAYLAAECSALREARGESSQSLSDCAFRDMSVRHTVADIESKGRRSTFWANATATGFPR